LTRNPQPAEPAGSNALTDLHLPSPAQDTPEWAALHALAAADSGFDTRAALDDAERNARLTVEACGLRLDLTRQRLPLDALDQLIALASRQGVGAKIEEMFRGEPINATEQRSVLHTALRLPPGETLIVDGVDVAADVHRELDRMSEFADAIRSGERTDGRHLTVPAMKGMALFLADSVAAASGAKLR